MASYVRFECHSSASDGPSDGPSDCPLNCLPHQVVGGRLTLMTADDR